MVWMMNIHSAATTDGELDQDLGRLEPVAVGAAVEHELQGADADRQEGEAVEIELADAAHGVGHEQDDASQGGEADRDVDVEHPAPVEVVGEVSADGRADDRRHHHAGAPQRHGATHALARG